MALEVHVECYAGYRADERPLRFTLRSSQAPDAQALEVKEVLSQWQGIGYRCFKVRADDGNVYVLRHQERGHTWTLESFERAPG